MALPTTSEQFLDLVRRSTLVEENILDAFLASNEAANARTLAVALVKSGLITEYHARQLLAGKCKGFFLGGYKVLHPLGKGSMGAVYLAEHQTLKRRVAIKVFATRFLDDEAALKRFQREARAAAALDHPNIIKAYDISEQGGVHFIVLEYVKGETLEAVAQRGQLPISDATDYIVQALAALQHASQRGVVHRDIKPSNLLVTPTGQLKVLDMGLARFFRDPKDDLTRNLGGAVLGTADYIAPEQALNSEVDIRADIYSLGATFYTLLTGVPPFHGTTTQQKLIAHQMKIAPPVDTVRPETPPKIARVIAKMMARKVDDRYQTPAEVLADLTSSNGTSVDTGHTPLSVPSVGRQLRTAPVATRDPYAGDMEYFEEDEVLGEAVARSPIQWWMIPIVAVVVVVLAVGGGWALYAAFHKAPPKPVVPRVTR
jgi:eukaryotic-like serine/threonine-protein kinase